jgi:hypothetical protein
VITRSGIDTCQHRTPAWVQNKARVCSVLEPWDPIVGGPDPIRGGGVRIPFRGPAGTHGGPGPILEVQTVYPGVRHSPMGGPNSLLRPWGLSLSLDTWRFWTR